MLDALQSLGIVKVVFFIVIILLCCIYSYPIFLNKRLRNPINILTVNVCLSCIACSTYWLVYTVLQMILLHHLNQWNCVLFQYFQTVVNCHEIYALCNVSINRFCIILYNNKLLFKTQRWIFMCIGIQWLIGMIFPLPLFYIFGETCGQMNEPLWLRIYILSIVLIIPTALFLFINGIILFHAHTSRRRVTASNAVNTNPLVNNRDIRLTKRMLTLLLLFLFGWSPIYIVFSIQNSYSISVEILKILPELSLLGEVINLLLYNREVRLYLKNHFFQ